MKHVGIIGAGIMGACIARELALSGCRVSVFEAHEPASGASSRSMGWINASFVTRIDYYQMRIAAIEAHRRLDKQFNGALETQWTGSLNWEAREDKLDALVDELGRFGHPVKLVSRDELRILEPELADLPAKALLMNNEGTVEAGHVTQVMLRAAQDAGAVVLAGVPVSAIERGEKAGHVIISPAGRVQVDDVVIAAGVRTGELVEKCGQKLPMKNEPGVLIETNALPFRLQHTIWSPDVHFKQLPDGRAICGNLFSGALGDDAVEDVAHRMLERMKQRLPNAAAGLRTEKIRHGVRPMPLDSYPAIGRLDNDVYVCVMHSGVTLGPLVGELVAREIASGADVDMLTPFRPSRFNEG
ncbi:MAG: FAD-dependent oxidoreductase [Pseudomonadota bacterium]